SAPTRSSRVRESRSVLRGEQTIEERPVALHGDAKVLGRDVLTLRPLPLERRALLGEDLGHALHRLRDQAVGLFHGVSGLVDGSGLDGVPWVPEVAAFLAR